MLIHDSQPDIQVSKPHSFIANLKIEPLQGANSRTGFRTDFSPLVGLTGTHEVTLESHRSIASIGTDPHHATMNSQRSSKVIKTKNDVSP